MKKTADIYVRVSTDEQADRGYSQRNQEEVLRKYCDINQISIRDVIYEDHSAKTFERPQWKKLLEKLRKFKYKTDLILFTKWDRFSRNAGGCLPNDQHAAQAWRRTGMYRTATRPFHTRK